MKILIPGRYWLKAHIVLILWVPLVMVVKFGDIFQQSLLGLLFECCLYVFIFIAVFALFLHRLNIIGVDFNAGDKKTKMFKYLKSGAIREKRIWKEKFSSAYYDTYLNE